MNHYDSSLSEYTITDNLLTISQYTRTEYDMSDVRAIVVHYVASPNGTAIAVRNYFESLKDGVQNEDGSYIKGSAHYIVGLDGEVIRAVLEDEVAIHTGSRTTSLAQQKFPERDANFHCIGIECCHIDWDGNYTNASYTSLVRLVADLLNEYNLATSTGLLRHNDISTKPCPRLFVNSDEWVWCTELNEYWEQFKQDVDMVRNR